MGERERGREGVSGREIGRERGGGERERERGELHYHRFDKCVIFR